MYTHIYIYIYTHTYACDSRSLACWHCSLEGGSVLALFYMALLRLGVCLGFVGMVVGYLFRGPRAARCAFSNENMHYV